MSFTGQAERSEPIRPFVTLETFILEGPEREVDAFWAEKGMGFPVFELGGKRYVSRQGSRNLSHYTTDRALRYVIEDRIRQIDYEYEYELDIDENPYDDYMKLIGKSWEHGSRGGPTARRSVIRKTLEVNLHDNRQVILAAARAMGLTYDG